MNLEFLGWSSFQNFLSSPLQQGYTVGRVATEQKNTCSLHWGWRTLSRNYGKMRCPLTHRFSSGRDWVVISVVREPRATIHDFAEKANFLARPCNHGRANHCHQHWYGISGLDRDFNLRRIERYLIWFGKVVNPAIIPNRLVQSSWATTSQ